MRSTAEVACSPPCLRRSAYAVVSRLWHSGPLDEGTDPEEGRSFLSWTEKSHDAF